MTREHPSGVSHPHTPVGPGRVLAFLYGLLAVAAGARSAVQLGLNAHDAPVAYALSAVAAGTYICGFVLVRRADRGRLWAAARLCAALELAGVVGVGTASLIDRAAFADASVWSWFGAGYLFVPLALPVAVLCWLRPGRSLP